MSLSTITVLEETRSSSATAAATSKPRPSRLRALRRRHALSVAVGPDGERQCARPSCRPTTCSTSRPSSSSLRRSGTIYVDADISIMRRALRGPRLPRGDSSSSTTRRRATELDAPDRGRRRLRRSLRGEGRAQEEGRALPPRRRRAPRVSATGANHFVRETSIRAPGATFGRSGPDVPARRRAARRVVDHHRSTRSGARPEVGAPRVRSRWRRRRERGSCGSSSIAVAGRRTSASTGYLARPDLRAEPRRSSRRCASIPLLVAERLDARGRTALVHGGLRPRQHPHQPAGAAVRARARRDDAPRPRRRQGTRSTTSATKSPARSSTSRAAAS